MFGTCRVALQEHKSSRQPKMSSLQDFMLYEKIQLSEKQLEGLEVWMFALYFWHASFFKVARSKFRSHGLRGVDFSFYKLETS